MGKARHNISNWRQYNRALVNRGSLTFWIDEQAIKQWNCYQHYGRRGVASTTVIAPLLKRH